MKVLTIFRMVVISFFLGLLVIFQMELGGLRFPFVLSLLAAATYLFSIVYLLLLKIVSRYPLFLAIQLALDLAIETAIIYYAGGVASPFTFFYMFTIIATAIVLPSPSAYITASAASILFGLLGNFEYYGVINTMPLLMRGVQPLSQGFVFFTVLSHIGAFFLIAYLSDMLSKKVRSTFIELLSKSRDLTNLQAFHENVITNMGSGFLALNLGRRILSANQAALKTLGRAMWEIKRTALEAHFTRAPIDVLLPPVDPDTGESVSAETAYVTPNGEEKQLAVSSSLFRDSAGKIMGYIVIFQDVTALRKMEAAVTRAERLASIGRISAGLAHEIRNPLGAISGSIQMLQHSAGTSDADKRLMSIILRETDRLNRIINRFLSSAAPSMKKIGNVNMAEVIDDAVMLFCNDAEFSDRVAIDAKLDKSIKITADPEALKQVLWNLFLNSAQAMEQGGKITISLKPPETHENGHYCELVVADTGCGIPEADVTKIFEPFYTTKETGTGLGLSTVLKIIESHDGSLSVHSRPGNGTRFVIKLPVDSRSA